jgi:hypothetical protein
MRNRAVRGILSCWRQPIRSPRMFTRADVGALRSPEDLTRVPSVQRQSRRRHASVQSTLVALVIWR